MFNGCRDSKHPEALSPIRLGLRAERLHAEKTFSPSGRASYKEPFALDGPLCPGKEANYSSHLYFRRAKHPIG